MTPLYLPSTSEMALYDAATIASGISGAELMERAGKGMAKWISSNVKFRRCAVLCGPGNNGGDGVVIARILGTGATAIKAKKDNYTESELSVIKEMIGKADLIIDALLGTGQRDAPRGGIRDLLNLIPKDAKVISVDVPTGMNADTGEVYEGCPTATATLTVEFIKRGMLQSPGHEKCGDIVVIPIGIKANTPSEFERLVPPKLKARSRDSHKGTYGTTLIVGGSKAMPGASVLSSHGALAGGAGLVKMIKFDRVQYPPFRPEVLFIPVDEPECEFGGRSVEKIAAILGDIDSVVVGPGLGCRDETLRSLKLLIEEILSRSILFVLDADALRVAKEIEKSPGRSVLTPHPGEAARILGCKVEDIQRNRYEAARSLFEKTHQTIVLKGASSIVYDEGRGYVNLTGTPWMAQGGAGDVLSGLIGALLAQGYSPLESAKIGVFSHGLAGEISHRKTGGSASALSVAESLPEALGTLAPQR